MSDQPQPQKSYHAAAVDRLMALLDTLLAFGTVLAQHMLGPNRDDGPRSSIDHAKFFRVERAVAWTKALMDVLSGQLTFTRPPATPPPVGTPPARGVRSSARRPRESGANPFPLGDTFRTIHELFTTRSISEITLRICIELDINPRSPSWPAELLRIYQTPAQWSAIHYPPDPGPPSPRLALHWYSPPPEALAGPPATHPGPQWQTPPDINSSA